MRRFDACLKDCITFGTTMGAIFQHLRFPFSLLLLPVFLLAVFEMPEPELHLVPNDLYLLFFVLHVLVYPSSNAYNSLQDRDTGSIGLVKNPLPVPAILGPITILLDVSAVTFSFMINTKVALAVMIYIFFSRLYSFRQVRLKRYAIPGFMTVFVFQGAWIFLTVQAVSSGFNFVSALPSAIVSSLLIGAIYPLSQIYQHQQDKADGVNSLSAMLGYKGTFLFSGLLFFLGTALFAVRHLNQGEFLNVMIFLAFQGPVVIYFLLWMFKVWRDPLAADFSHTMRMTIISSICMNGCFILLNFFR